MKNKGIYLLICACFLTLILWLPVQNAQGQGEEGKTKMQEHPGGEATTKEKFHEEKKEFEREAKDKIGKLDKEMDELEAKLKHAGAKAKSEAKEQMRELREKRAALKKDMKKLKASGKKTWHTVKEKVEHSIDELEEGFNKVRDKI